MSDRAQLAAYIQALYNRIGSSEERPGDLQEVRHYLGQFKQILTQSGPDAEVWAELHTLREAVKGPDGFATWQDAATAERVRRVKAENELKELKEAYEGKTYPALGEAQIKEVCRKQTNSRAVEAYWESFLRISNAVQEEFCRVHGLGLTTPEPCVSEQVEESNVAEADQDHAALPELLYRIDLAMVGSCTCQTKTPRLYFHSDTCAYKVLSEAKEALRTSSAGHSKIRDDAVNLMFALRDAWPYVHQWCHIDLIRNKVLDLIRKHGDFADTYVPSKEGIKYKPLSPEFKEKWIKALTDGSHIQSGYKALRHSSSYSALGVAKNIQGAVWKLGLFQLPTYQDLLSGETEKYVPVLNQEQIDPEALKALEKIQREHPFYEVARWIKYNL